MQIRGYTAFRGVATKDRHYAPVPTLYIPWIPRTGNDTREASYLLPRAQSLVPDFLLQSFNVQLESEGFFHVEQPGIDFCGGFGIRERYRPNVFVFTFADDFYGQPRCFVHPHFKADEIDRVLLVFMGD